MSSHINQDGYKTKLNRLLHLTVGIAALDGGLVIALQTITFLLTYFCVTIPTDLNSLQKINAVSGVNMLISIISMLNLSVIIYRIGGITRGVKHHLANCYLHALKRWPWLMLLYILGGLFSLALAMVLIKLIGDTPIAQKAILISIFALLPYGFLACVIVVDQNRNPLYSIRATYDAIVNQINISLLATLSIMYLVPVFISSIASPGMGPYVSLITSLWFLFCHILTIVVYFDSFELETGSDNSTSNKDKKIAII